MASIMIQGTASSVGKSLLAAAFCRIFNDAGLRVAPFKSQNMSLNSYVTDEGLEMGRAQVLQAQAARVAPSVLMNPILLKPTTNRKSQVILQGKPYQNMDAAAYFRFKPQLREMIRETYQTLHAAHDVIVIEGAGSPAEINLKAHDIVNMGMAEIADAPVLLVADIDRGGVFASLYGTVMLLEPHERARIKGLLINKFRGDKALLTSGLEQIHNLTGIPVIGVLPYIPDLQLDEEDSAIEFLTRQTAALDIGVIKFPRMSNFTDFDAFRADPDVMVRYLTSPAEIGVADMLILPGSKNTIADLRWLKQTGFADALRTYPGIIMGICGGYQMLGQEIIDVDGWEGQPGETEAGLGLFPITTRLTGEKITTNVQGMAFGCPIYGYEIHTGRSTGNRQPFVTITRKAGEPVNYQDGDLAADRIYGTYIHGIFDSGALRGVFLNRLRQRKGLPVQTALDWHIRRDAELNRLADIVRANVDLDFILGLVRRGA